MIYLTAQKVSSARKGTGINCFLYQRPDDVPREASGVIDLKTALGHPPGELVNDNVEIAPGGNRVQSYLDIVAPDPPPAQEIEEALAVAREALAHQPSPVSVQTDAVGVQFHLNPDLHGRAEAEFDELKGKALALLRRGETSAWRREQPLVVLVEPSDDAVTYRLDDESEARLCQSVDVNRVPSRIRIEHATFEDLRATLGSVWPQIAMLLTGLDQDRLLRFGGICFRDGMNRALLIEWPVRHPA